MERAVVGEGILQLRCSAAFVSRPTQTTTTTRGLLGFASKNSRLGLNHPVTGVMASAEVESSPKTPVRGLYERFRDVLHLSVTKDTRETSTAKVEDQPREDADGKSRELTSDSPKIPKAEKLKKKKPIVSSSTVVPRVEVCIGKKCKARGSEALLTEFQTVSNGRVEMAYTKCMHECKKGMNTRVTKDGTTFEWHHEVSTTDVEPILCKHFDW